MLGLFAVLFLPPPASPLTEQIDVASGGKVEQRIAPYRDKVALHERNIEAIQKEIAKLR